MADQTKAHLWINTGIAIFAFAASAVSASYSWRTYALKNELIGFTVQPNEDCRLEYEKEGNRGLLGLCWIVTITNESDSRTSLVTQRGFQWEERGGIYRSGFTEVEDSSGSATAFPVVFDAGEAKRFLFRVPVEVPLSVAKIVDSLSQSPSPHGLTLAAVNKATLDAGLDILGNSINVEKDASGKLIDAKWPLGFKEAYAYMTFKTGRGKKFEAHLSFPPLP